MYRDDYILRMIRQLGQVVTYVLGLRRRNQYPLALIAIDNALRDRLGIGSEVIAERSDSEILALVRFSEREEYWREVAAYIAALLHAEAMIYEAQEQHDLAVPRAFLATQLLVESSLDAPEPLPDYAPPLDELLNLLREYALPDRTHAALFQLCEQQGDYAEAENQLFFLLDQRPDDEELRSAGIAFARRLLALDEAALRAGGLSRAEALELLEEIEVQ